MICEMVQGADATALRQVQQVLPKVEESLKSLVATASMSISTALQALIVLAEYHPNFFKLRYQTWIDLMLEIAAASSLDPAVRLLSFEWVSTLTAATKALLKVVQDLPARVLSIAFLFLCEVNEDTEEDEGLHKEGEAKVDFFVKKFGFAVAGKPLMKLVASHGNSWKEKVATAMAIRAAGEYADDPTADQMAECLLQLLADSHTRVHLAALFALGQLCHDRSPNFNEAWCDRLMPVLLQGCGEANDIAVKAISAMEAHLHGLSGHDIRRFSDAIMAVLMQKLQSTDHQVIVASLEAIGALAISLDDGFDAYDSLIPMLLTVLEANVDHRLREKTFECISLTGFALSKEKFAPAAAAAVKCMFATPSQLSDCLGDAVKRICKVLGKDFADFLPHLVPNILKALELDSVFTTDFHHGDDEDDLVVAAGDGAIRVKTGQLTEMVVLLDILEVFMKHTAEKYTDFVRPTSEALAKLLCSSNPSSELSPMTCEIRSALYPCWAELVGLVSDADLTSELVQNFVDKVASDLMKADDAEEISSMAQGIVTVIHRGIGSLRAEQVKGICDLAVAEITQSFQRDATADATKADAEVSDSSRSSKSEKDEDFEHLCRTELLSIITSCMQADARAFMSSAWPTLQALMQQWFTYRRLGGAKLALHLASNICQHLGEEAVTLLANFMDLIIKAWLLSAGCPLAINKQ
eukprot:Skav212464  [mRNA]  locus=scaffold385:270444:272531:- [translate_table: standard]